MPIITLPSYYVNAATRGADVTQIEIDLASTANQLNSAVGVANGIASLDSSGQVPIAQMPSSIVSPMVYRGVWNATTNTPTLVSGAGNKGDVYRCTVAGSTNLDGFTQWNIGDAAVFNGTTWDKWDGIALEVLSVFGQTGAVPDLSGDIVTVGSSVTTVAKIAGVTVSGNSGTGNVVFSTSPTLVTPTLGVATATTVNKVTLTAPATGSTLTILDGKTLTSNNTLTLAGTDSTTITFQGTDTYVGRASTDTLTNKTFDTAGTGNVLKINGTTVSATTGTGSVVLATSPTLVTPTLGVATATTVNKVTLTAPATGSTLTILDGKTLTSNNTLTLAGTDSTTITFQGTDTYVGRATTDTLTNKTFDTAGTGNVLKINGTTVSTATGTGSFALSTSPTFVTPVLGAAIATSINFGGTALGNYIEGTFVPTLVSSGGGTPTYSVQTGYYTRVGNRVIFGCTVTLSALGTLAAGTLTIQGLPLTSNATANYNTPLATFANNLAATAVTQILANIAANTTIVTLYKYSAGAVTLLPFSDLAATASFYLSGAYIL